MRVLAVLLVACTGAATDDGSSPSDTSDPAVEVAPPYTERGPWPAGTEEAEIVGTDGLVMTIQVWYPATEEGNATVVYDDLLAGDAYERVAPDCAQTRPLIAFSHGLGGIRYQSPFFAEFLASHGYVVVAPDHVGNTFLDPTGDIFELFERRPVDLRDAVDWVLAQSADAGSDYAGCLDPADGYAVSGHSFGGYTAFAAAGADVTLAGGLADERVWAVVAMAPWDGAGAITTGTSAVAVPTLILTGARDETTPLAQVEGLWTPMTVEPRYFGVFADAGHYSFSPVACLINTGDGCGDDFVGPNAFTADVNLAAAAFLEGTRGVEGAIEQLPLGAAGITWESAL